MTPANQLQLALAVYDRLPAREQSTWATGRKPAESVTIDQGTVTVIRRGRSKGFRVNSNRPGGVPMSTEQRNLLTRLLTGSDMSHKEIAMQVRVSSKTVSRWAHNLKVANS